MLIYAVTEPEYAKTIWCGDTVHSMLERCRKSKYTLEMLTDSDSLCAEMRYLIVLGTTPSWVEGTVSEASEKGVSCITIGCATDILPSVTSCILTDHKAATRLCLEYLSKCGKSKTALYGVNTNSYSDMQRISFFKSDDIYYNYGLAECYRDFALRRQNGAVYDSVICSNYIVALSLIRRLKEDGESLPHGLYIAAFGDSALGMRINPSVTTVTLDHAEIGRQAVLVYAYLMKQERELCVSVKVPSRLLPGASTDFLPFEGGITSGNNRQGTYENTFLDDDEAREIQSLEAVMSICDDTDCEILYGLIKKESYSSLSERLYTAESSVKYRIKRMMSACGAVNAKELSALAEKYLGR